MTENVVGGVKTLSQDDVKAAVLGALNSLDAKADRGAAYLVSKGGTSSNWYRVWSDGFIEQGGLVICTQGGNTNGLNTVSLMVAFTSTKYGVNLSLNSVVTSTSTTDKIDTETTYGSKKTTSFILCCFDANNYHNNTEVTWVARGY